MRSNQKLSAETQLRVAAAALPVLHIFSLILALECCIFVCFVLISVIVFRYDVILRL